MPRKTILYQDLLQREVTGRPKCKEVGHVPLQNLLATSSYEMAMLHHLLNLEALDGRVLAEIEEAVKSLHEFLDSGLRAQDRKRPMHKIFYVCTARSLMRLFCYAHREGSL